MAVKRDLSAEQRAVGTYQKTYGKTPDINNPEERAKLYRLAYPVSSGLPDELKASVDESIYSLGRTPTQLEAQQIATNKAMAEKERTQGVSAGLSSENQFQFGQMLQDAIKTKIGAADQPLGESEIFKKAGLTGYATLAESLAQHGEDMKFSLSEYRNFITNMTGTVKAKSEDALRQYEIAANEYENEANRLQSILDKQQAFADQIKLYQKQHDLQMEEEQWRLSHPDIASQISADTSGYNIVGGKAVPKSSTQIVSQSGKTYDMSTYAADPEAHSAALQNYLNNIGKFNTVSDIDNYIKTNKADSPITGQMIANAATKSGIGWEELTALIQHEAILGTSNVSKNNNNPGGITWSQSYQNSHPGVSKGTARPSAEGGNYVKFATLQDGINAVAEQLSRRVIGSGKSIIPEATISKLEQELLGGKTGKERTENEKTIRDLAKQGKTVEEIRQEILTGTSGVVDKNIQNAVNKVINSSQKSMSDSEIATFKNSALQYAAEGDIESVKETLKEKVKSQLNEVQYNKIQGLETTLVALKDIKQDLADFEKMGGNTNIFTGTIEDISRRVGLINNVKQREIAAKIGVILQIYRKDMTGVAFSPQESDEYKQIFPNINNVGKLNSALLNATSESFNVQTENLYRSKIGSKEYDAIFGTEKTNSSNTQRPALSSFEK